MLQSDDWQTLKARKRLVTYIIEKTKARHCGHLILYRRLARIVLNMLQEIDRSANPFNALRRGFADDQSFHELMLAQLIKKTDLDLRRMIETQKIDFNNEAMDICKLYARLVIGHEDDLDCGKILSELRVGLPRQTQTTGAAHFSPQRSDTLRRQSLSRARRPKDRERHFPRSSGASNRREPDP